MKSVNNESIQFSSCLVPPTDLSKVSNDVPIILDIALAIIICLGEASLFSPVTMGSVVIGVVLLKMGIGGISLGCDKKERKKVSFASKLSFTCSVISAIAMVTLSACLFQGYFKPSIFAGLSLGIDVCSLFLHLVFKRTCGQNQKRYSCFQSK